MFRSRHLRALVLAAVPAASLFVGSPASHAATSGSLAGIASPSLSSLLTPQSAIRALLGSKQTMLGSLYKTSAVVAENILCDGTPCPSETGQQVDYSSYSVIQLGVVAALRPGTASVGAPQRVLVECGTLTRTQSSPAQFSGQLSFSLAGAPGDPQSRNVQVTGTEVASATAQSNHAPGFLALVGTATPYGTQQGFASFHVDGANVTNNVTQRSISGNGFKITTTGSILLQSFDKYLYSTGPATIVPGNTTCQAGQVLGNVYGANGINID